MKKVIALYGKSNVGKSTTIKEFAHLAKKQFSESIEVTEISGHSEEGDIRLLITIHGTLIVGIESQGDPGSRLEGSLNIFVKANCDVIFCATRTKGNTCHAVNALQVHGYGVEWIKQVQEPDASQQALSNRRQAVALLDKLLLFIPAAIEAKLA